MIALEFQGLVEARQGSGVYVTITTPRYPKTPPIWKSTRWSGPKRGGFFKGEACALSAAIATEEQLTLARAPGQRDGGAPVMRRSSGWSVSFHVATALATNNAAIVAGCRGALGLATAIAGLRPMLRRARRGAVAISWVSTARSTKPCGSATPKPRGKAIHTHLGQVIDNLLTLAETDALQQTRQKIAEQRRAVARRNEI